MIAQAENSWFCWKSLTMDALRQHPHLSVAIQLAQQRALAGAAPVILRVHVNLPRQVAWWDVWSHWQQYSGEAPIAKTPLFAWHDGRSTAWVLGLGACQQQQFAGAKRFVHAQALTLAWRERLVEMHLQNETWPEQAPVWCAGFAFAHDFSNSVEWQSFAAGQLLLPQICLYQLEQAANAGASTRAVVHALVAPHEKPDHVYRCILENLSRLNPLPQAPATDAVLLPHDHVAWQNIEHVTSWHTRVNQACAAIQSGTLHKVVLARSAILSTPKNQPICALSTLRALRVQYPSSICFAWQQDDKHCFVGATPELLVQVAGKQVRTQALAGTAPRGQTPKEDEQLGEALLANAKNLHEHRLVVEALRHDLAKRCATVQVDPQPHLIRLLELQHLETQLVGWQPQVGDILWWLGQLHPTPALGGAPKAAALAYLLAHEPMDRGWYAGPIGWLSNHGDGAFAVAIRSALLQPEKVYAYAGAGIVATSDALAEWQETVLKLRTIQQGLRMQPNSHRL